MKDLIKGVELKYNKVLQSAEKRKNTKIAVFNIKSLPQIS